MAFTLPWVVPVRDEQDVYSKVYEISIQNRNQFKHHFFVRPAGSRYLIHSCVFCLNHSNTEHFLLFSEGGIPIV